MKKRIAALLLGAFMLVGTVFALGGCGGGGKKQHDPEGNVVVKMSLMNSTNENPGWLAMIDAANALLAAQGEKVRIEAEIIKTDSWDQYYTKITTNIMGRIGGTIGRIAESHVPMMIDKNQVTDLTEIRNELVATGKYNESAFEGVAKKDGKYYALPSGTQHMVLAYNKTIFDAYNAAHPDAPVAYPSGDWDNPSTFAEIRETARKLSSGEGVSRKFGLSAGPFLAYAGMYAKNSGGENIFDATGACVIKSQPFYDVYEWFDHMLKTDRSMPTTTDTAASSAIDGFLTGNIAMMIDGVWQLHDMIKYTQDYEIGIAAIPVKDAGYEAFTTTFTDRFWAASTSRTPEEDKIALKALMSVEAITALSDKSVGGFPVYTDCIDNYVASLRDSKLAGYVDVIIEGTNHAVNVPYLTYYNQVDQRINQRMAAWINGDYTSAQFVDYMDEVMKKGTAGDL